MDRHLVNRGDTCDPLSSFGAGCDGSNTTTTTFTHMTTTLPGVAIGIIVVSIVVVSLSLLACYVRSARRTGRQAEVARKISDGREVHVMRNMAFKPLNAALPPPPPYTPGTELGDDTNGVGLETGATTRATGDKAMERGRSSDKKKFQRSDDGDLERQ